MTSCGSILLWPYQCERGPQSRYYPHRTDLGSRLAHDEKTKPIECPIDVEEYLKDWSFEVEEMAIQHRLIFLLRRTHFGLAGLNQTNLSQRCLYHRILHCLAPESRSIECMNYQAQIFS